jgi:hypothetical protein
MASLAATANPAAQADTTSDAAEPADEAISATESESDSSGTEQLSEAAPIEAPVIVTAAAPSTWIAIEPVAFAEAETVAAAEPAVADVSAFAPFEPLSFGERVFTPDTTQYSIPSIHFAVLTSFYSVLSPQSSVLSSSSPSRPTPDAPSAPTPIASDTAAGGAPGGTLASTGGPPGAASPLFASLSLVAVWRAFWLAASTRPTGIVLPSLAPPG